MSQRRATKQARRKNRSRKREQRIPTAKFRRTALVIAEQMRKDDQLRRTYLMNRDEGRVSLLESMIPEGMGDPWKVKTELERLLRAGEGRS